MRNQRVSPIPLFLMVIAMSLILLMSSCATLPDPNIVEGTCHKIEVSSKLAVSSLLVYRPDLRPVIETSIDLSLGILGDEDSLSKETILKILSLGLANIPMKNEHRMLVSNIGVVTLEFIETESVTGTLIVAYLRCFLDGAKAGCEMGGVWCHDAKSPDSG